MKEPAGLSTPDDVLAAEPVLRRVIAARMIDPADVDDLVQDCLERLLTVRGRLARETVLPYGIVTARNLVVSHARTSARRAAVAPKLADPREDDRPDDVILADETRRAMTIALARLSPQERGDILSYYSDEPRALTADSGGTPGAVRVRMARTRAKLRLEYLLAFRGTELPTAQCRKVLLAISSSDTRRQQELRAGQHLLECETCAELSEPLEKRSLALTGLTLPVGFAAWGLRQARAHPAQATVAAAAAAVAVAAAVVVPAAVSSQTDSAGHADPRAASAKAAPSTGTAPKEHSSLPPSDQAIRGLTIGGKSGLAASSIRTMAGRPASARGVLVESVVTHNGFWVGSARARLWVELVGALRPLHIVTGDRVSFAGVVIRNGHAYAARAHVTRARDAALLARQGAHIAARTTSIRVSHRS